MKILYGITKSNFGGAQRYVFDLATAMKRGGHDVAVLCGQEGKLVGKLRAEKIRVITLNDLERNISITKEISSFFHILKVLKQERPDVFHINSSKMGGLGSLAGRIAGTKKIIFTAHNWAFNWPRPVWQMMIIKFLQWLTVMLAHLTICVSEKAKNDATGWPFVQYKLKVIHICAQSFEIVPRNEAVEKLSLNNSEPSLVVGTTSELQKVKGLDILLTAWSKFIKNRNARLVIVGSGEERENLENMAKDLGISGSVIFKGFIDNARSLLSGFDIFCMPSRSEGLPYGLLEAGLAGLPVIATNVGGIPEIIESGINGVLVPSEDSEALFSSLILLAEDANLRKRLGANLKSSIQENFSFEKMVSETFALY